MAYDPILKVFKKDYQTPNRSNWNLDNKNRLSMDIGYLYPVAVFDVLPNTYFKLDMNAVLSSNPTIAPILGSLKFRAEAFFVEKAAYASILRNNERLSVDRDVPWPTFRQYGNVIAHSRTKYSPATGLLEHLNMYPVDWQDADWAYRNNTSQTFPHTFNFPELNAIPFIMYHDIYRNYYINVQDSNNIPIRQYGFASVSSDEQPRPIVDRYVTRDAFDSFVEMSRDNPDVESVYIRSFGFSPFADYEDESVDPQGWHNHNHKRNLHRSLLRRTYNNDFFTSFISNENVELMKSHSNIDTSSGMINVEQISLANRNWRFATRSLLWGTDWSDYNRVHFGTKVKTRYGKPQFLGSLSSDVIFSDIVNQSQDGNNGSELGVSNSLQSNKNLGSRAGIAFGSVTNKTNDKKNYRPFIEFTTEEEGYVMILLSLVPVVDYYQGVAPMYFKVNLNQSYSPEYNSYGMQDFMKVWASALPSRESPDVANITYGRSFQDYNTAIHKVPIWFEYMARYNELHGLFTLDEQYKYWTFTRIFTHLSDYFDGIVDTSQASQGGNYDFWMFYNSTYVLPEMHNYQFANVVGTDNFQVQISFDTFVKQLLDKQIIAYL